eukprot:2958317-Prymnesium_polylepis.2
MPLSSITWAHRRGRAGQALRLAGTAWTNGRVGRCEPRLDGSQVGVRRRVEHVIVVERIHLELVGPPQRLLVIGRCARAGEARVGREECKLIVQRRRAISRRAGRRRREALGDDFGVTPQKGGRVGGGGGRVLGELVRAEGFGVPRDVQHAVLAADRRLRREQVLPPHAGWADGRRSEEPLAGEAGNVAVVTAGVAQPEGVESEGGAIGKRDFDVLTRCDGIRDRWRRRGRSLGRVQRDGDGRCGTPAGAR